MTAHVKLSVCTALLFTLLHGSTGLRPQVRSSSTRLRGCACANILVFVCVSLIQSSSCSSTIQSQCLPILRGQPECSSGICGGGGAGRAQRDDVLNDRARCQQSPRPHRRMLCELSVAVTLPRLCCGLPLHPLPQRASLPSLRAQSHPPTLPARHRRRVKSMTQCLHPKRRLHPKQRGLQRHP